MRSRLLQSLMRFGLVLLWLAAALSLGAPAHSAVAMAAADQGCGAPEQPCSFVCPPAAAEPDDKIAGKLPAFSADASAPRGAPAARLQRQCSARAAIAAGSPAYLSFHRLLL